MATSWMSSSSSLKPCFSIVNSKTCDSNGIKISSYSVPCIPLSFVGVTLSKTSVATNHSFCRSRAPLPKVRATSEDVVTSSEPTATEASQQIVSTGGDTVSTVIQGLLFAAFVALSILTIGVIYLGVTDFLQKREKDKFEKEEADKKTGKKKKVRARARAGPRGFGQKFDQDE